MGKGRIVLLAALAFLGTSCNGDRLTNVVLEEYLVDVSCDSLGRCVGPGGESVEGTWVEAKAIASSSASMFRPSGTYMYIDYMRGPTYVEIEMDFPTDLAGEAPLAAVMREYDDGELAFESQAASGVIQVAPPGGANRIPRSGGFHLKFLDHGPDSEMGTSDDEVREIRNGRFDLETAPAAGEAYECPWSESAWDDPDFGVIIEIWVSPDEEEDDDSYDDYEASGCEDDGTYQDDTYDGSTDQGGCEGDTTYEEESGTDGSGGCDSGDWSADDGSGGCEGDTYDGGGTGGCDCEGDTAFAARRPGRRTFALFVPAFAILITRSVLRRRS